MKSRGELPHLYYPQMNQTRIINPHRNPVGGGGTTFGNNSREFDGVNDYVDVSGEELNNSSYSVAFWLRLDASASGFMGVFGHQTSIGNPRIYCSDTNINFDIDSVVGTTISSTSALSTWNHFVYNVTSSTSREVFKNGASAGTNTTSAPGADRTGTRIGKMRSIWPLKGRIADLRVYSKALSGGEISSLYAGTDVSDGLIGWRFLDTDDVLDWSPTGNDGTNNGSTFSTDGPFD